MFQGEIWWADLPEPVESAARYCRPVIVVQSDAINRSGWRSVVCVVLTSNMRFADLQGNVVLPPYTTGLPGDSVANVNQIVTMNESLFLERTGQLPDHLLDAVLGGFQIVVRRW